MIDVTVLDDGRMQVTADGVTWAPLTVEAVQALAARLPEAVNAASRVATTTAAQELLGMLAQAHRGMNAVVTTTATSVGAVVDADTFDDLAEKLKLTPDPTTGALSYGPLTITKAASVSTAPAGP